MHGELIVRVESALPNQLPNRVILEGNSTNQECISNSTELVGAQKGHEETKTDEDHNIDVLPEWVTTSF